jgi:hypothetical protein
MENVAAPIILAKRKLGMFLAGVAKTCVKNAASRKFSVNRPAANPKI